MYYSVTVATLRDKINEGRPRIRAKYREVLKPGQIAPLSYLLWMCDEVEKMDRMSDDEAQKAARWIGWMLAHAEINGLWDNEKSRDLVRTDRRHGFDKPFHNG